MSEKFDLTRFGSVNWEPEPYRPWMGKEHTQSYTVDDWILRLNRCWIPPDGYQYVRTEKPEGWGVNGWTKHLVHEREWAIWQGCPKCHKKRDLQVHHLHYRSFCQESIWDLLGLCNDCHHSIHYNPQYTGSDTEIRHALSWKAKDAEEQELIRSYNKIVVAEWKAGFTEDRRLDRWFAKTMK